LAIETETLITLTADIVSAHVGHNSVSTGDIGTMIEKVYAALLGLDAPVQPVEEKLKGAVSIRSSIKPDYIVSMIDGRPYKLLKRHLTLQGYTPESYREAFGLPKDYPMVAASYAATRRDLAKKIGLGRKRTATAAPEIVAEAKKPAGRGRPKKSMEV